MLPLAYLDPGSGSLILQALIGAIAAGWVAFRQFFARRAPRADEATSEREDAPAHEPEGNAAP